GHLGPEARSLRAGRLAGADTPLLPLPPGVRLGVRHQVEIPGGVLVDPALGGDQDQVVAVRGAEERMRAALAALAPDRFDQGDRRPLVGATEPAVAQLVDARVDVGEALPDPPPR